MRPTFVSTTRKISLYELLDDLGALMLAHKQRTLIRDEAHRSMSGRVLRAGYTRACDLYYTRISLSALKIAW